MCDVDNYCDNEPKAPHTCPYREDVYGDYTTKCTCCDECRKQCAYDI